MFYIIYKVTNILNSKIYIGVHQTLDINDDYMGSGKHLKRAQKKYGIENFKKEILFQCTSLTEMYNMESYIVNEKFVSRKDTYNLKTGGNGGFHYINQNKLNVYGYNGKHINSIEGAKTGRKKFLSLLQDETYYNNFTKNVSDGVKLYFKNGGQNGFYGKHHNDETKKKIGTINSKHQKGQGNSQYGKIWIYNLELKNSFRILKHELSKYINLGYQKGRIIDFNKLKTHNQNIIKKNKQKEKDDNNKKIYAEKLFEQYINNSCKSLREFVRIGNYNKSHVSLTRLFKKYITNYNIRRIK